MRGVRSRCRLLGPEASGNGSDPKPATGRLRKLCAELRINVQHRCIANTKRCMAHGGTLLRILAQRSMVKMLAGNRRACGEHCENEVNRGAANLGEKPALGLTLAR